MTQQGLGAVVTGGLIARRVDRDGWRDAARRFADYSYRQSWPYAQRMARDSGSRVDFLVIERDGEIVGAASVRVKQVPILGGGVAYVAGGPLVRRWGEAQARESEVRSCLEVLTNRYVRREGRTLRIQFPLSASGSGPLESASAWMGMQKSNSLRPYRTIGVDLSGTSEEIRARLHQKWRNQLNAGLRKALRLDVGDRDEHFARFGVLFNDMLQRKGFDSRIRPELFHEIQAEADEAERTSVLLAHAEGEDVAGIMVSFLGDAPVYLLGATATAGMQLKAAYVLQWEAMRMAKEKGCRHYDLGGIDPEGNPGVHHFKEGFGGADIHALGPMELEPGGIRSVITTLGEHAYRRLMALRGKRPKGTGP